MLAQWPSHKVEKRLVREKMLELKAEHGLREHRRHPWPGTSLGSWKNCWERGNTLDSTVFNVHFECHFWRTFGMSTRSSRQDGTFQPTPQTLLFQLPSLNSSQLIDWLLPCAEFLSSCSKLRAWVAVPRHDSCALLRWLLVIGLRGPNLKPPESQIDVGCEEMWVQCQCWS